MTSDWDLGDGLYIMADKIRARDNAGLYLSDDAGNGIFVEDGGKVGIGTAGPSLELTVMGDILVQDATNPEVRFSDGSSVYSVGVDAASNQFWVGGDSISSSTRMKVNSSGNMWLSGTIEASGSGTSIFSGKLDVTGTVEAKCFEGFGVSPIGAIIAWHKSFANTPSLPDGWIECNGQVLNDTDSPYNGQTIPDLNSQVYAGGRGHYLRGGSTSGSFNGSSYWTDNGFKYGGSTSIYYGACYAAIGRTEQSTGTLLTYSTSPLTDRTFQVAAMTVVWIMRVK